MANSTKKSNLTIHYNGKIGLDPDDLEIFDIHVTPSNYILLPDVELQEQTAEPKHHHTHHHKHHHKHPHHHHSHHSHHHTHHKHHSQHSHHLNNDHHSNNDHNSNNDHVTVS